MIDLIKPVRLVTRYPRLSCFTALVLGVSFSRNAAALPTFPGEIQKDLSLNYTPPCIICHTDPNGGIGTATTDFAVAMKAAGLNTNISTVGPALTALNTTHPEYIQALEAGLDPNTGVKSAPAERYGCGARISTAPLQKRGGLSIALAALSLGLLFHRLGISNRNFRDR